MGFNTDKPAPGAQPQGGGQIAAAVAYLRQGLDAEAFLLLADQQTEQDPAARFALGLCYLRAGGSETAILCFEQALRLLRSIPVPPASPAENGETYLTLARKQIADQRWLAPLDADFCLRFPKAARDAVLLALISIYRQKGMTGQARKLAAGLTGPVFETYKAELWKEASDGNI
jgi:tetratricopeptide (TPR) repeat protein